MATARTSNIERARWRSKCRQKLSEHISEICFYRDDHELKHYSKDETLGLPVEPLQVRLIPTSDDPYVWKVLPGKEHLFEKQLSKHSIGAYMELYREVGCSFEAILPPGKTTSREQNGDRSASFSAKIEELERDKLTLAEERCEWKRRAEQAENALHQLKMTCTALKKQDTHKMGLLHYYRNITMKYLEEANSAFGIFMLSGCSDQENWEIPLGDTSSRDFGDVE